MTLTLEVPDTGIDSPINLEEVGEPSEQQEGDDEMMT